ncbi:MAG: hypothetical protein QW101_00880 [Ignisphaera sp.]|uniref:Uncharacterized protein n=1 Tax=Ignisphaera aggregans TaxID=334771 RepID=A0A7J3MYZ6_9CREN
MRRQIFRKIINIVVEGYAVGDDAVELRIKPVNSEVEITNLCIEKPYKGGNGTNCRKVFLYVDQECFGNITLDAIKVSDRDTIDLNANIKFYTREQ